MSDLAAGEIEVSRDEPLAYQAMTLVDLAGHLAASGADRHRWRLIAEFG